LNIGILASEGSWYFRDLERAAQSLGQACVRLDFEHLVALINSKLAIIQHQPSGRRATDSKTPDTGQGVLARSGSVPFNEIESLFDVVLVRTMPPGSLEQVVFRMDVLARMEAAGTRVINSPKALECAVDKYLTTARLQAGGLPVPQTIVCEHEDAAMSAFDQLGGDVVVKPLFGAEGRGIVRVTDPDLAHRTFRTLMRLNAVLYLQRFVEHGGCDVRIMVLDGKVLGGMRRRSPHDFRTNVAREATAEPHQPTPLEVDLALKAATIAGTFIAGIDLLYDRDQNCYVIEVNAVPGWQAFGRVNQIDVATTMMQRLQDLSR
jgi:ribosomal protein S6--L-glutamate ligase